MLTTDVNSGHLEGKKSVYWNDVGTLKFTGQQPCRGWSNQPTRLGLERKQDHKGRAGFLNLLLHRVSAQEVTGLRPVAGHLKWHVWFMIQVEIAYTGKRYVRWRMMSMFDRLYI